MELVGQQAKLRIMKSDDVEVLYNIVQETLELWTHMVRRMNNLDDMINLGTEASEDFEKRSTFPFIVIDEVTNTIVGSTRLYDISSDYGILELGSTFYDPTVQKTRINTECKYLLLQHAFEKLDMVRVQIKTDIQNIRAQEAIEQLGAAKEGILCNEIVLHNGRIRDAVVYSFIKEKWPSVKVRLENYLNKQY
ncbi:GNAT family protein [Priestia megaterium]|uniref:GNAT family N-acetyltransferase n=1 Tax=Priestia megaterium TaxID=1404 RepID=UPI002E23CD0B|nr:GNAT family protein [Priestia megaterium]MED4278673.1 GNAT family protein [Priestia megaterium]MED4319531.1 GNAT family protein [Priestia megaterium]